MLVTVKSISETNQGVLTTFLQPLPLTSTLCTSTSHIAVRKHGSIRLAVLRLPPGACMYSQQNFFNLHKTLQHDNAQHVS